MDGRKEGGDDERSEAPCLDLTAILRSVVFAAMPNSSGGAVVTGTNILSGLHMGTIWHLEALTEGTNSGGSSGGSSQPGLPLPPATIERDQNAMWKEEEEGPVEAAAADAVVAAAAHLSRLNIGHKSCAGLFVPATALRRLLLGLGLTGRGPPLDAAGGMMARIGQSQKRSHGMLGATC
jgi:hypothetical protein